MRADLNIDDESAEAGSKFPVFPVPEDAPVITLEKVRAALEAEDTVLISDPEAIS